MVMDRDDVDAVGAKHLEHRLHLGFEHRHVPRDHGIGIRSGEGRPRVESHASVDPRAVLAQVDVGPADRDLVDRTALLTLVPDDLRDRSTRYPGGSTGRYCRRGRRARGRGGDECDRGLQLTREIRAAVSRLAGIVHDLDVKDARFGVAGTETVGMVIDGLQLAHPDDHALLAHGITLFEALYCSIDQATRRTERPRAARRGKRKAGTSRRARK